MLLSNSMRNRTKERCYFRWNFLGNGSCIREDLGFEFEFEFEFVFVFVFEFVHRSTPSSSL
jgi:hypothetical protein